MSSSPVWASSIEVRHPCKIIGVTSACNGARRMPAASTVLSSEHEILSNAHATVARTCGTQTLLHKATDPDMGAEHGEAVRQQLALSCKALWVRTSLRQRARRQACGAQRDGPALSRPRRQTVHFLPHHKFCRCWAWRGERPWFLVLSPVRDQEPALRPVPPLNSLNRFRLSLGEGTDIYFLNF